MNSTWALPTKTQIIQANRQIVNETGEPHGFLYESGLDSMIQSLHYLDDPGQIASAILFKLIKSHIFLNGNKRTAALVTTNFLSMNGLTFVEGFDFKRIIIETASKRGN